MTDDRPATGSPNVSRRAVARGVAWTAPVIAVGAAAPALAASPFKCPSASCYSVLLSAGAATVGASLNGDALIAMIGATVTFSCATQYGFLGGWSVFADTVYVDTTDAGRIKASFAVTIPQPSPLAIPVTIPATGFTVPGWKWDDPATLLPPGQTNGHHVKQICIQYTAIFYGLGIPPIEVGRCRFQVCYTTTAVTNWNTIALTAGPATPL